MDNIEAVRARKKAHAAWDLHRQTIEELYHTKQLEGCDGLIELMKREHNFTASKAQYEHQFRKWGLRKYRRRKRPRAGLGPALQSEERELRSPNTVNTERSFQDPLLHERLRSSVDRLGLYNQDPTAQHLRSLTGFGSPPDHGVGETAQLMPTILSTPEVAVVKNFFSPRGSSRGSPNIHMRGVTFLFPHAFSWITALNWHWIETLLKDTEAVIKFPDAKSMRLKAISYQADPISTICATSNADVNFAQYLVSTLLNNVETGSSSEPDSIYNWLGRLPQSVVLQFLKALPPGHSDIFRERLLVAAMIRGDVETIQSVLNTGFDLHQAIDFRSFSGPELPLVWATRRCSYPVAKAIVTHASRINSTHRLEDMLEQMIKGFEDHSKGEGPPHDRGARMAFQWSELLHILIHAGARPTTACLKIAVGSDVKLVRYILDHVEGGVQGWIEAQVLKHCLNWKSIPEKENEGVFWQPPNRYPHMRLIYSYILQEKLDKIQSDDPASIDLFRKAFRSAIAGRCTWAMDMIMSAASHLRIGLVDLAHGDFTDASVVSAHRDSDWVLLEELTREVNFENVEPTQVEMSSKTEQAQSPAENHKNLSYEHLVSDWDQLLGHLNGYHLRTSRINKLDILELLASGCCPKLDDIVVAIVLKLDHTDPLYPEVILRLFRRANVTVVSQLILQQEHWNEALLYAARQHDFDALEDLIYRRYGESIFHSLNHVVRYGVQDMWVLRALAYHAIDTDNDKLLRWLLEIGLPSGENISQEAPPCSLLAVAASQNNAHMTQVLLAEGAESKDSDALMWAVAVNADNAVIEILLAAVGQNHCKTRYGGAALRAAIVRKNYGILRWLSRKVDPNSIESLIIEDSIGTWQELVPLSPMGEAIYRRDLKAAEILIEEGAKVCGVVALRGYIGSGLNNKRGTLMNRATTLLAAIDTENLLMVKLLVERGADVNHSFRPGFARTPLQRAAEIGNFEIVQYLLECGAHSDSAPCYKGGTPLQLTAIGGYVGIAELLLEYGADVNHLPAEGEGRTAFEGAAEWARVDMMSLLVSRGLDFDLVVDEDGHTQYERAMDFAKRRGQPASKRFVERLRKESAVDVINWPAVLGG